MTHEDYMREAIELARSCMPNGDVPVGCVITAPDGSVIGWGCNRREAAGQATAHAEVEAINMACSAVGHWRLTDCTMYVTLEPCPMCAGAIVNARIAEVHYGTREEKTGACGSVLNLFEEGFGSRPRLYRGPLETECAGVLTRIFTEKRQTSLEI